MKVYQVKTLLGWYGIPVDWMINLLAKEYSSNSGEDETFEELVKFYRENDEQLINDFVNNHCWKDMESVAVKLPEILPEQNDIDWDYDANYGERENWELIDFEATE